MFSSSLIVRSVLCLAGFVRESYSGSITDRVIRWMVKWLRAWLASSWIVSVAVRPGQADRIWEHSRAYGLYRWVLGLPSRAFRRLYVKFENIYRGSLLSRCLDMVTENLHILLGGFIFLVMVFPYERWNNLYASLMLAMLLMLFVVKVITGRADAFNPQGMSLYAALFAITVVFSCVFSVAPGLSLRFLVFYINCFLTVLLLVSIVRTKEHLLQLLKICLIGLTVTGIYGVWQAYVGVPVIASQIDVSAFENFTGRIYSTIGNANDYAEILVLLMPFYAALFLNSKTVAGKLFYAAMAVPSLGALVFTMSRSSWIGFVVALLIFISFTNWRLLPVVGILGIASLPFLPPAIMERIKSIFTGDSSTNYRTLILKTVNPMLKDYWFTGVGLGTDAFTKIVKDYPLYAKAIPPHSHNLLLQIWLETGILGLLSYMAFLLNLFKNGIRSIFGKVDPQLRNIIIAAGAALCGVMVTSLAEYIWFERRVMLIFWAVVGILMTALSINKKMMSEEQHS